MTLWPRTGTGSGWITAEAYEHFLGRKVVGRDAFIAGTFDPHGNEDAEFLRQADLAFCAKYFPHYDSRLQGERTARMLIRAIRGDYTPATATVKVPILWRAAPGLWCWPTIPIGPARRPGSCSR